MSHSLIPLLPATRRPPPPQTLCTTERVCNLKPMPLNLSPNSTQELSPISLASASSSVWKNAQGADSRVRCDGRAQAWPHSGRRRRLAHRPHDGEGWKALRNSQRRSVECHRVGTVMPTGTGLHHQHQLLHPEITFPRPPRGLTGQGDMQKPH